MTAVRPPTPAEETALRVLLKAEARRQLTDDDLERLGRAAITRIEARIHSKNGAPGVEPGTPIRTAEHLEGHPAMTIIQRHARDLHAGDVITADPDHHNRPVRWRVTRPPVLTSDGEYALADYTDLESDGHGIAYYRILTDLPVEPAGGAA